MGDEVNLFVLTAVHPNHSIHQYCTKDPAIDNDSKPSEEDNQENLPKNRGTWLVQHDTTQYIYTT